MVRPSGAPGRSAVPGQNGPAGLTVPASTVPLQAVPPVAARLRTGPAPIASARIGPTAPVLKGAVLRGAVVMDPALKAAGRPDPALAAPGRSAGVPAWFGPAGPGSMARALISPVSISPVSKAPGPRAVLETAIRATSVRALGGLTAVAPWAKVALGDAAPSPPAPMAPLAVSAALEPSARVSPRRKAVSVPRARKAVALPGLALVAAPLAVRPLGALPLAARPRDVPPSPGQAVRAPAVPSSRPGPTGRWWSMPPRASPKPLAAPPPTT